MKSVLWIARRSSSASLELMANLVPLWWRVLRRRSQGNHLTWRRLGVYAARWLPTPRICHPYPRVRFAVTTQGTQPAVGFRQGHLDGQGAWRTSISSR